MFGAGRNHIFYLRRRFKKQLTIRAVVDKLRAWDYSAMLSPTKWANHVDVAEPNVTPQTPQMHVTPIV
jgi:hypothetical protein